MIMIPAVMIWLFLTLWAAFLHAGLSEVPKISLEPIVEEVEQCGTTSTFCPSAALLAPHISGCCSVEYSPTGYGCHPIRSDASQEKCCKPGPRDPPSFTLPNCLILGDSVSIGYTTYVAEALKDVCQVQHGPWDVSDGGAGSTAEGLVCLGNYLVTQNQTHVQWDVILFNFGLHNLNNTFESKAIYRHELTQITNRLVDSTRELLYALTTPFMPAATKGDYVVDQLNEIALQVMMLQHSNITIVDLNNLVHQHCGGPIYRSCDWCDVSPCSYHYSEKGKVAQGRVVAEAIRDAVLNVRPR